MDAFGCDAPQFLDFENLDVHEDRERIESYFDCDHEKLSRVPVYQADTEDISSTDNEDDDVEETDDQSFYTPMHNTKKLQGQNRLSISMVCLSEMKQYQKEDENQEENDLSETLSNTIISTNDECVKDAKKQHSASSVRQKAKIITPRMNNATRLRTNSNMELNLTTKQRTDKFVELAKPKSKNQKYVSMIEAINKFQCSTPVRFHSKPKGAGPSIKPLVGPTASTIPQSPALATKVRSRPNTAISSKEIELRELEAQKKFKIKANPVNRKVLEPMKPVPLFKKPPTEQQPFNITEMQKKEPPAQVKENREFHARPMPKAVPKHVERKEKCYTIPSTPNVLKRHRKRIEPVKPVEEKPREWKPVQTQIEPFTFDQRDKNILNKKELRLKLELEETKKNREFHARPLPKKIYQGPPVSVKMNQRAISLESLKSNRSGDNCNKPFKPRPPVSLLVEPFIPKKSDRPLTEISEFQLNSERRVLERREYDEQQKEKERMLEYERQLKEEEEKRQEELAWKEQRKLCQHKPQPIRKFKQLPVVTTKPPTIPHSPNFAKQKNKENSEPLAIAL